MRERVSGLWLLALAAAAVPSAAAAQTIVDAWASVVPPPPPALVPVTVDPRHTALLLLDFNGGTTATSGPCNTATKPRCRASLPSVGRLLGRARAAGVVVVYSTSQAGAPADIEPEVAPAPGDPVVKSGPDKFIGTDLARLLAGKDVATLIVTGTAAEGAVLDTGTDAALHGMTIVVPVDGMSSTDLYAEQYVAWHLTHAPGVAQRSVLTRSDLVGFGER